MNCVEQIAYLRESQLVDEVTRGGKKWREKTTQHAHYRHWHVDVETTALDEDDGGAVRRSVH